MSSRPPYWRLNTSEPPPHPSFSAYSPLAPCVPLVLPLSFPLSLGPSFQSTADGGAAYPAYDYSAYQGYSHPQQYAAGSNPSTAAAETTAEQPRGASDQQHAAVAVPAPSAQLASVASPHSDPGVKLETPDPETHHSSAAAHETLASPGDVSRHHSRLKSESEAAGVMLADAPLPPPRRTSGSGAAADGTRLARVSDDAPAAPPPPPPPPTSASAIMAGAPSGFQK